MKCNNLFCVAETHADELHVDVTGYTWREPVAESEVIAHVYTVGGAE